jgi:cobalamin synthase
MALGAWLVALAAPAVKRVLASLGIGIVSYAALSAVVTQAINSARSAFGGITGDLAGLLGLAGMGEAAAILAAALMARVTYSAAKRFVLK